MGASRFFVKVVTILSIIWVIVGCSPVRRINHELRTKAVYTDHFTGVSLYDPAKKRPLIQYNADKPFTPASNTKLFSFYAGLLNLPDSLPALQYAIRRGASGQRDSLIFWGTGNPLLLHPDLPDTTVLAFLRDRPEQLYFSSTNYSGPRFGSGWAWDDYNDDYSAELAPLPVYGNVVRFKNEQIHPRLFIDSLHIPDSSKIVSGISRDEFSNQFWRSAKTTAVGQDVPFRWSAALAAQLLADTLHRAVRVISLPLLPDARLLRGTSTDSLYKRMLHVSDNQFAEQIFFMISAERNATGTHSITLEPATELRRMAIELGLLEASKDLNSAKWADGSGLSRYNLFTPNVLIELLGRIWTKVPRQRLFALLPAMGQAGTSRNITVTDKPYVFAKSGSMSGVYNLSGYVQTQSGKLLYFSIMHNNFTQPVGEMRRRTAELLNKIHKRL